MNFACLCLFVTALGGVHGFGLEQLAYLLFDESEVKVTLCDSIECEEQLFLHPNTNNELLVYLPTVNIDFDPYMNQYIGVIFELFQLCDNAHFVISSFSHFLSQPIVSDDHFIQMRSWREDGCSDGRRDFSVDDYSIEYCEEFDDQLQRYGISAIYSPNKIVLVAINDPIVALNIVTLKLRQALDMEKPVILHLNQELPWQLPREDIDDQKVTYELAFKVFRTVYYDEFDSLSSYVPVRSGALVTAKFLTPLARESKKYHTPEVLAQVLKASDRPVLCSFAGGLKYSTLGGNQRQDRVEMVTAFRNFSHCDLFASDDTKSGSHKLTKYEYIELMRGSAFVLCPTGLNPETQRPHQALDLGAIPLSLRVSDSYMDYLSQWRGYPGPLFDSWEEARLYVESVALGVISQHEIDVLQRELQVWYEGYLQSSQLEMRSAVEAYMAA